MQLSPAQNKKLDFLVIGAAKCGTTWLADMLRQHPGIFVPAQKELHYFNRKFAEFPDDDNLNFDKPLDWYLKFFEPAQPGQKIGELCPSYLWDLEAPSRIHAFDPGIKLLALLRNPVERTYSAYRYGIQRGVIDKIPLKEAIVKSRKYLVERSQYYAQLKRYYELFPAGQIHVWIVDRPNGGGLSRVLEEVEQVIGVERFIPKNTDSRSNMSGEPRFWFLSRGMASLRRFTRRHQIFSPLIDALRRVNVTSFLERVRADNKSNARPTTVTMLPPGERAQLMDLFREDIAQLAQLLKTDLSFWQ